MIGARLGVAFALVVSIAALAAGVAALMATVRDNGPAVGRLVQTRLTSQYDGPPVSFVLDDFFVVRGSDGRLHAWYAYPPGYFGRDRGCKILWDPAATITAASGATVGPGLFIDPCGGARFDRDGELISGPADRNLDQFPTSAAVDGTLVDTRRLLCGSPLASRATPRSGEATATPQPATCRRASPNAN